MLTIENDRVKIVVHTKGAELQSVFHKEFQLEYMWNGDPTIWGKHSPLLFPIVGTLKDNQYHYSGQNYSLNRHGFARDMEFMVERQQANSIGLLLKSGEQTKSNFPFDFELRVIYRLTDDGLTTTYKVKNPALSPLYFSVGGHPAFKVPVVPDTEYSDYYLEFNAEETSPRWPISKQGLIETFPQTCLDHSRFLPLTKQLFARDALVFKHIASSSVALRSKKTPRGFRLDFPGFPFLGIWAAPGADFVCVEPWCGIADSTDSQQDWENKEGINMLGAGEVFEKTWTLALF